MKCRTRLNEREQMNTTKIILRSWFGKPFPRNDEARMTNDECGTRFVIRHSSFAIVFALAMSLLAGDTTSAADPRQWVAENMPSLVELYRHLHQTPELSLKEKETSARMAKELRDAG